MNNYSNELVKETLIQLTIIKDNAPEKFKSLNFGRSYNQTLSLCSKLENNKEFIANQIYFLLDSISYNYSLSNLKELNLYDIMSSWRKLSTATCECCNKTKPISQFYCTGDYTVCNDCEEDLDNKTGYCDMSCRLSGTCSQAC